MTFHLLIARVDGPLFEDEATALTVPGSEGEMTILPRHTPLVSALKKGTLTVRRNSGETESFDITHGVIEVSENRVTVLVSE